MREIKFRAWHLIVEKMINLDDYPLDEYGWFLTSDILKPMQYTGLTDKNGVGIYEGDILEATHLWRRYKVVIKFGRYLQDGSAGEYTGNECIGFYAEAIHKDALDEDEFEIVREEMHTASILDYEDIVILGNIYEHSRLLEGEAE